MWADRQASALAAANATWEILQAQAVASKASSSSPPAAGGPAGGQLALENVQVPGQEGSEAFGGAAGAKEKPVRSSPYGQELLLFPSQA